MKVAEFTPNARTKRGLPVIVEYHDDGTPDALGRRHFSLQWLDARNSDWPGHWTVGDPFVRGQHFFANPAVYLEAS